MFRVRHLESLRYFLLLAGGVALCALSRPAAAFPELVRHGYANCITCHISPSGGGVLTEYGRALSAQILSSAAAPNEEKFLYNAVPTPDWLSAGGDLRTLLLYQAMGNRQSFKYILMQADAEAAVHLGPVTVDATGGMDYDGNPISRRHYINYRPTDNLSFRIGKFMPQYGINTENHSIGVKRGLGKDQGTETYNVEAAWIGESFDVFATAILGRPDNLNLGAETGAALSSSVFLGNGYKIGVSYYYGTRDVAYRHVAGPFAILGFTRHFFLLAEADLQWLTPTAGTIGPTVQGCVDDMRLDYEVTQGVHFYLLQEYYKNDFRNPLAASDSYGGGFQWFPRPHLELNVVYLKQRIGGSAAGFGDYAYAMAHLYL